jgi:hypothetical protein
MHGSLAKRIRRLESIAPLAAPVYFRYGPVKPLPTDYDGPKHVVAGKRWPAKSPYVGWYEFEESRGARRWGAGFSVCWDQADAT